MNNNWASFDISKAYDTFLKALDTMSKAVDFGFYYFNNVSKAGEKWAEYGWVPFLPQDNILDLLATVNAPLTQKDADDFMLSKIDQCFNELLSEIEKYVDRFNGNKITFSECLQSFNSRLYTSCALNVFALIDHVCIINQQNKKHRRLAQKAISEKFEDSRTAKYFVIAFAVNIIINDVFKRGDDFNPENEGYGNRNFIAHGMNTITPDRVFCLKLFVLLYNTYLLYSTKLFFNEGE